MKVIGAGLPRTGTLSQKVALETLGFGPCYHMVNVLTNLPLAQGWEAAIDGEPDWDAIFGEHESTVDWPGSFFYRELADAYPDAKVVLSVRDPEAWEKSMITTIWDTIYGQSVAAHLSKARELVDPDWQAYIRLMARMWAAQGIFSGPELVPGQLADAIARYQEQVQRNIPEERLLVWSVGDGWEPLCRFLEVDVPDTPFPRLNDSKMYVDRIMDAALMVLGEWRARNGEMKQPARQPA
ncbi:MAG TPA: sulfotransferase [Solirubrobacteraceae bacterium]|nr:sulfotransferase [Solirubrobacteraceae bacterium]